MTPVDDQHRSDAADEYERMHPFSGNCKKHGGWASAMDECPKCMNENDIKAMIQHEASIPDSICWGCGHCHDEPGPRVQCGHYGFPVRPIKKKCKYFTPHDDSNFDSMEGMDPGCEFCVNYDDQSFPCHQQGIKACKFVLLHVCDTCNTIGCDNHGPADITKAWTCQKWAASEEFKEMITR